MNNVMKLNGENFFIERLAYIPLNKQQPLYLRPHTLNADMAIIDTVANRVVESAEVGANGYGNAGIVTPNMLNDIASSIIRPSTVAYETIINQGWMHEDRFVFILKVNAHGLGGETNTYIQGFTNCAEISTMGEQAQAAHDLVHHISSVIETTVLHVQTPMGMQRVEKLSRVYDVITDKSVEGIHTQRPTDIIDTIKSKAIAQSVNAYGNMVEDPYFQAQVINAGNRVNRFSETAKTSRMDNNISSLYLANVINEGVKDYKKKDVIYDSGIDIGISYPDYTSTETIMGKNRFLKYLSTVGGYQSTTGDFTFNDLLLIDPHGANNFELGNAVPHSINDAFNMTPHMGGGEYWNQQDPTTIVAYSMLQSAISMTAKYGFAVSVIHVDNKYSPMLDTMNVAISDSFSYLSVGDSDKMMLLESLRNRFFYEVFMVETAGGVMPLKADIYVDMIGDSKIYIEFADGYGTWYTLPTVANSYSIPTISKDLMHYNNTADMFGTFIDTVSEVSFNAQGLTQPMMPQPEPMDSWNPNQQIYVGQ